MAFQEDLQKYLDAIDAYFKGLTEYGMIGWGLIVVGIVFLAVGLIF